MTNSFVKEGEVEYVDEITMRSSVSASSSKTSPFMKSMPSPVFHYEYPAVQFECMDAQLGYLSNPLRHENAFHDAHLEYVDPSQACYLDTKHFVSRSLASSAIEEPYVEVTEDSGTDSITAPPQMVMSKSMMELDDLLSKLNPMAEEFTPPSQSGKSNSTGESETELSESDSRKKNAKKSPREAVRGSRTHREDSVKRTVYVADIDQEVTEEQLARLFLTCGQVVDCRVCGDPNSVLRFAFVEFTDEGSAKRALELAGTVIGYYPLRVLPSKTAIVPVNPTFLPRSLDERELCARTIYCANIDRKITQSDVKLFFESLCGEVSRLRLLGDNSHSTRIAFVEFTVPESAVAALNCSGAILGSMPIRVSPSKTPVRTRGPRGSTY